MLQIASEAGLIFNGDKFQFGLSTLDFAGLEITDYGVRPSKKIFGGYQKLSKAKEYNRNEVVFWDD